MTSETYFSNQKIGKLVLHKVVRPIGAEILPFQFPVAAILDFLHNGHQGSPPTCVRWFLKTLYPYLTPCKVKKNCHKSARFLQILTYSLPAIEKTMSCGVWTRVAPRNRVLSGGRRPGSPGKGTNLGACNAAIRKNSLTTRCSCCSPHTVAAVDVTIITVSRKLLR